MRFTTGAARGAWRPILLQDAATNRLVLAEPLAGVPSVGDVFVVDGWR